MVRLYLLKVFFQSGLVKIQSWQSTLDLFAYEYTVPLLPPEVAAFMATGGELILPVLLLVGFLTRPAAIGLFILNFVAAISYPDISTAGYLYHVIWGVMLAVIFAFGPGRVSIDRWISDKLSDEDNNFFVTIIMIAVLGAIGYFLATKYL
jgi:putative oxidoreductase